MSLVKKVILALTSLGKGLVSNTTTNLVDVSLSTDSGNSISFGSDNGLMLSPSNLVSAATGNVLTTSSGKLFVPTPAVAASTLLSTTSNNAIALGADSKLWSPMKSEYNYLHNSTFSINQLGTTFASNQSYAYAANTYIMDRWYAGPNGCTFAVQPSGNLSATISITAGQMVQAMDTKTQIDSGTGSYLFWTGTAKAAIINGSGGGTAASPGLTASNVSGATFQTTGFRQNLFNYNVGGNVYIVFQGGTVTMPMLVLRPYSVGTTPAPWWSPRPIADELLICQRYYVRLVGANTFVLAASGYGSAAGANVGVLFQLPTKMSIPSSSFNPVVTLIGTYQTVNTTTPGAVTVGCNGNTPDRFIAYITTASAGYCSFNNTDGGGYSVDASLW